MKKQHYIFFFFLLLASSLTAQTFDLGNSWYKSRANQDWVKLVVDSDGVYRVSKADLQAAGYDLNGVQGDKLHLFYREKEVPLYIGSNSGSWVYFDFVGRINDGRIDSIMYRDPLTYVHSNDEQPNKEISLFTDESAYFLTWDNTPSGARYFSQFDPTYSLYTPEPTFRFKAVADFHPANPIVRYVQGGADAFNSYFTLNSDYVTGEGYQGPGFGIGNPATVQINTPSPANNGTGMEVETRIFGRSLSQHFITVDLNGNSSTPVLDTQFVNAQVFQQSFYREYFPTSSITEISDLTYSSAAGTTDNNNVSYASITYSRLPDLGQDSMVWISDWDKSQKAYLRLNNVNGSDSVYVYDLKNQFRNVGTVLGTQGRVIIQGFGNSRDLLFVTEKGIGKPRIESPALNKLHDPSKGAEYVIITDRKLAASAQAYANYRDTATVTEFTSVRLVYVDEIYDEYGYGSLTPWAIKRFCKEAIDNWNISPRYFLLWGKGRYRTREYTGSAPLVPTFGYPATDYEFVCNWSPDTIDLNPDAAIGRVNIYSDTEGLNYLQKVNEYEHTAWDSWMKKGVFLGGGANVSEQGQIGAAFRYMITRFDGIPFGGNTVYFQKTSSSVVLDPNEAGYHDEITSGAQIIHFFGHSTSNIQDVAIREPFEYNSFGRYPLMIAMGCYGGDFTVGSDASATSFGERWVKEKGRGAIGYVGNSSAGYLDPLRKYGRVFYDVAYGNGSGQPMGDLFKNTLSLYADSLRGIFFTNHGRQMNLQGDPAVKLYLPQLPDLEIIGSSIFFNPQNFSAQDDSFRISIIVENKGLTLRDSFTTTIRQRLPGGSVFEHPSQRIPVVGYKDTISVSLINPAGDALTGQNFFEVRIDSEGEITEFNESNNFVALDIIVPGNIPAILSPREYAIVPDNKVTLQASTVFMTNDSDIAYIFEIDSVETFDSPFKARSGSITGSSFFAGWEVPFTLADSAVYYWRVRLANVKPEVWTSASFRYIDGKTGWSQSQLPQFRKDTYTNIDIDFLRTRWQFNKFASEYDFSTREGGGFTFSINGSLISDLALSGVFSNSVAFIVLDQYTLEPKLNFPISGLIGNARVPGRLYNLKNAILQAREGDYIIVGSHYDAEVSTWPEDIFDALKLIGVSDNIRNVQPGKAFLIMGRKGFTSGATEVYSPTVENKYSINTVLYAPFDQGIVSSTKIGPALSWESLWWDWETIDPEPAEEMTVSLYAIDAQAKDSLIYTGEPKGTLDFSTIKAERFPYLRLEATGRDTTVRTAPQLEHWHVLFEPAPDIALDAVTNFEFRSDTLVEGEEFYLKVGARNVSELDIEDSILVVLYLDRQDRARLQIDSIMIAPLAEGAYEELEFQFNTLDLGLDGFVNVVIEINPGKVPVEQHYFNNIFSTTVFVEVDNENPLVDVTFDGKHIINGDFVSPDPEIVIEVNDENTFLTLDDTAAFEIYLRTGLSILNEERIFVGDPRIDWVPATQPENKARVYFYPGRYEGMADGVYAIRVQGKDRRNNVAGRGANLYEINFEVMSQSTITRVLNYPNPFSTSTRFVYTLTGSEMPEMFQIHIYTLSGKMVKNVDLIQLGDVHLGQNITEFAWDGTDEYGDQLANGVYIYKVFIRMPSEDLETRDTGIEQYFNNGWGKMYLMR